MRKYVIMCAIFVSIITIGMLLFWGANWESVRQEHVTAELERAVIRNGAYVSEAHQYTLWMLNQYNISPNVEQLKAFGGERYTVCKENEIVKTAIPGDEHSSAIVDDVIYVTTRLGEGLFVSSKHSLALDRMRRGYIANAASTCFGLFLILSLAFTVIGAVFYFYSKRLTGAMEAMASGDYSVRIKGGDTAKSFNSMARNVNENVIAANAAAQSQRDFVANFSHELKTPLTAIIGYADLLRSAELDQEDAFTAASYIFSEGKRLESLSLKLMDMIVLDKQSFELRPLPASKLLQHIAITVRPMLSNHMLSLEFHAAAARIEGERDLIITLVMNLLDNARKASPEGGKIILRGTVEGDRYKISIKDHGRGIPKEELGRITEAFYMVDKSRARAQHGAGLGLALSQRIAQMHGSSLEFISQEGEGTEVSFSVKRLLKTKELADEN